ncbi:MAG: hypothetical protein AAGK02_02620 [Pseudomonadota bacterium]
MTEVRQPEILDDDALDDASGGINGPIPSGNTASAAGLSKFLPTEKRRSVTVDMDDGNRVSSSFGGFDPSSPGFSADSKGVMTEEITVIVESMDLK